MLWLRQFPNMNRYIQSHELENQEWYHGFLPFEDIAELLVNDGDFLLRALDPVGEKPPMPCVTVKWKEVIDQPIHYRVRGENRLFSLDGMFRNPDIIEIIKFHKESGTPIGPGGARLITPIPKQKWELTRNKITIGEKIGEGHFSEIFAGTLQEGKTAPIIEVAIKKVRGAVIRY
ncbi:SH2 domain protein [Cooperia oncophora]